MMERNFNILRLDQTHRFTNKANKGRRQVNLKMMKMRESEN